MIEIKPKQLVVTHKPPNLPVIYFQVPFVDALNEFKALEGQMLDGYTLSLVKKRERSLTANNYMWQLCDKIAMKIDATKEDVYREAIEQVGLWNDVSLIPQAVDTLFEGWEKNGLGWFGRVVYQGTNNAIVRLYTGSSVYDGEQMRRLVDFIVDEAKSYGIDTITPSEKERLIQLWGEKVGGCNS